jgi:hypothetical protein
MLEKDKQRCPIDLKNIVPIFVFLFVLIIDATTATNNHYTYVREHFPLPPFEFVSLKPPTRQSTHKLLLWIDNTTDTYCIEKSIAHNQCFAIFRYLLLTYAYKIGNITQFYIPSNNIENSDGDYISPILNLTAYELKLNQREILTTPTKCFSKTLLVPDPDDILFKFDLNYVIKPRQYGEIATLNIERLLKYRRYLGLLEKDTDEFVNKARKIIKEKDTEGRRPVTLNITVLNKVWGKFQTFSEKYVWFHVSTDRNIVKELKNFCSEKKLLDDDCQIVEFNLFQKYIQILYNNVMRCISIESKQIPLITSTGDSNVQSYIKKQKLNAFAPRILIKKKINVRSKNNNYNNEYSTILKRNLWYYAFDKTLCDLDTASNIEIVYSTPESIGRSYHMNKHCIGCSYENESTASYATVIRHPITKKYLLYYRQNHYLDRVANVEKFATRVLYSNNGIDFFPLNTHAFAAVKSNIVHYDYWNSQNFFPMVDSSTCSLSDISVWDNRTGHNSIYIRNKTLEKYFPNVNLFTFKGIGGRDELSEEFGVNPFYSSDGINWLERDRFLPKKILSLSMAAKAGFNGVYFDTMNNLLYDHDEERYKIFARHNPAKGIRSIQLFVSKSQCEWKEYLSPGIPLVVHQEISPSLAFYTPSAQFLPGSSYIIFLPTAHLSKFKDCATYVTFMYSVDGGRNVFNDILSIFEPHGDKNVFFDGCVEGDDNLIVYYSVQSVNNIVESTDCKSMYVYTIGSEREFPVSKPNILNVYKYRYGGIAALETLDKNEVGIFKTTLLRIPEGVKMLVLNYNSSFGYIKVSIVIEFASNEIILRESEKLTSTSALAQKVVWKDDDKSEGGALDISNYATHFVKLKFEVYKSKLFGFMFVDDEASYVKNIKKRGAFCTHKFT